MEIGFSCRRRSSLSNGGSSDGAKKNKNQEVYMQKERYEGIDGLKAYAIIELQLCMFLQMANMDCKALCLNS